MTRAVLLCALAWCAQAQERDEFLYLAPASGGALKVAWIPAPVLPLCLGKTLQQCVDIDYCIRTTNRDTARCRSLPVNVTRYPRETYPRRVLVVTYFPGAAAAIKRFDELLASFSAKKAEFDHLSPKGRFKARIRVRRSADDDEFDLLEVLTLP